MCFAVLSNFDEVINSVERGMCNFIPLRYIYTATPEGYFKTGQNVLLILEPSSQASVGAILCRLFGLRKFLTSEQHIEYMRLMFCFRNILLFSGIK